MKPTVPRVLRPLLVSFLLVLAFALVACGGSDSGDKSSAQSSGAGAGTTAAAAAPDAKPTKWAWLFEGPVRDGGFNESFELGVDAVKSVGDVAVTQDQLPYTEKFTQAVSRQIANGNKVLVEALGAGELFKTCTESTDPDVKCYTPLTDPKKIPKNTVGYWQAEWNLQYVAGVAAGLKTKSNTLGFVSPFKLSVTYMAINAFTLGCRSVNPDCQVRVITINSYFAPAAEAKAANTLIDAGADVLSSYVNDPTYCKVAADRGVFAIGLYTDGFAKSCAKSVLLSTVYDVSDYFKAEAESIRNGTWEGGKLEWIEVGAGPGKPHLSNISETLTTPEMRAKIDAAYKKILGGESPFKGPIVDQKGKVRVAEGTTMTNEELWYGQDYFVKGVIASS
jgi:basic membrane lipoprotein Med (substrate-binding protein (PBP1-ABC) superfamily)